MANEKQWKWVTFRDGLQNMTMKQLREVFEAAVEAEQTDEWRELNCKEDYDGMVIIEGQRRETDEEMREREENEERAKNYRRRRFEELKKEFEGE